VMAACPGISKSTGQDSSENEEAMEVPATTPLSPASSESSASQESSQDSGHSKRSKTKHTQPTRTQSKDGLASATADSGNDKSKGEELPSSHQMPDLRVKPKPDPEKEAQQRIIIAKLPEMERTLVALIRECRKRHLIVTPDALLRVARETVPDEIPNIGTILELLGALELKGVIERDAGILKLSSRVG
ncbi:DNA-processing protein DprA, partial [Bifidobacterium longum]